ncbi:hypothetical protein PPYR_10506, partial [Photinus pyralis]
RNGGGRGKNGSGRGADGDREKCAPDYGNPHIIGGSKSGKLGRPCKSSRSNLQCMPLEIACCNLSTVLS